MYNTDLPNRAELPSSKKLLRSTLLAAITASVLLSTIVLPSEYAIDPTGIGRALGLTQMGEIKMQLAAENTQMAANEATAKAEKESISGVVAAAPAAVPAEVKPAATEQAVVEPIAATRTDTTVITLKPGDATEIKLKMTKDATVEYQWTVAGGVVNFDTHADSESIDYHGYGKGKGASNDKGVLTAAFDGNHGWFWRNRDNAPVTVTLVTTGKYDGIKKAM